MTRSHTCGWMVILLGLLMMYIASGPVPDVNTDSLSNKSGSNESSMLALNTSRWMPPSSLKLIRGPGTERSSLKLLAVPPL